MTTGRIEAIGFEDKTNKASYSPKVKKLKISIGDLMNGYGSYINNFPDKFNSAFTVGKPGAEGKGAFLG